MVLLLDWAVHSYPSMTNLRSGLVHSGQESEFTLYDTMSVLACQLYRC
jgi:hypothetical protein